jgi:hypothetical protein
MIPTDTTYQALNIYPITPIVSFAIIGLIISFLVWRELRNDKLDTDKEAGNHN